MNAAQLQPSRNFPLLFFPLDIRLEVINHVSSRTHSHIPSHTLSKQKVIKSRTQTCKLLLFLVQMFVHVVQLGCEVALDLRPPALERGRQQAVLHRERIRVKVNVFDLFE